MLPDEFNDLEEILWEDVQADEAQSQQSTCGNDHIAPEVRLWTALCFLNGGRVIDLCRIYSISPSAAKSAVSYHCLHATDSAALFDLFWRWKNISTCCGVMWHHLLALDSWLPQTDASSVPNLGDYYSVHYTCDWLNDEVAVGPSLEFMYLFVTGAGKKNNSLLKNPVDNSYSHNMDQSRQSW